MLSIALLVAALGPQVPADPAPGPDPLVASRSAALDRERAALEAVAAGLERAGKAAEAAEVRGLIEPERPEDGPDLFTPLPEYTTATTANDGHAPALPPTVVEARDEAAEALMALARRAAAASPGRFSLADACLRDVLERRPDDPEARRLLGFVPFEGGWATPVAAEQLRKGSVLHEVYGWVPADWVEHLDSGELPGIVVNGRPRNWLPAAEADALRADFSRRAWEISTVHFEVRTNAPLSEAIAFGRRLEEFHDLFFALMGDVIGADRLPLALRFADLGAVPAKPPRKHQVWFFAEKSEYVDYLKPFLGAEVEGDLGRYLPDTRIGRRSYFYRDLGGSISAFETLYHEVSHQLLFESVGLNRYKRNVGNYWVWEGLGTYFETVEPRPDGRLAHGGRVGPRVALCRALALEGDHLVPTARLTSLDHADYYDTAIALREPRELLGADGIARANLHYNESMAFCIFLMQAASAEYRDEFFTYVRAGIDGRLNNKDRRLFDYLGVEPSAIDRDFAAFLRDDRGDAEATATPRAPGG